MKHAAMAEASDYLVYMAILVYTLAMVAYAVEVAFGRSLRALPVAARESRQAVGAMSAGAGSTTVLSSTVTMTKPPAVTTPPAADRRMRRTRGIALSLTRLGFLVNLAGLVTRGIAVERAPWGNMYEFAVAGAVAVVAAYLVCERRYDVSYLGVIVVPIVLLDLGLAVTVLYTEAEQLVPSLQSSWLVIHVAAAILSSGLLTLGAALSVLQILRGRSERRGAAGGWTARLPVSARLDRLAYQVHAFAFPIWTFAVIAGAIWAENAWGRYWGWDPKETWAFITWVIYAAYLHARATAGWKGTRASSVALVGYAALLFNFFGVNFLLVGFHSYAGVG